VDRDSAKLLFDQLHPPLSPHHQCQADNESSFSRKDGFARKLSNKATVDNGYPIGANKKTNASDHEQI
jgi:hypothetical protein